MSPALAEPACRREDAHLERRLKLLSPVVVRLDGRGRPHEPNPVDPLRLIRRRMAEASIREMLA